MTVNISIGETATQSIDSKIGTAVIETTPPLFIGVTDLGDDAGTVDAGPLFPGGFGLRRYFGTAIAPEAVPIGAQTGYIDFRAFSGEFFWNHASIDVVVDTNAFYPEDGLPPAKMRFLTASNEDGALSRMEILPAGRVEIGAIVGENYYGPGGMGNPKFYVNQSTNDWAAMVVARPATGLGYAIRLHTLGTTANDYLIGGSSGTGTGSFTFTVKGNGDVNSATGYHVAGNKVVGPRQPAVELPIGGSVQDTESRATLAEIIAVLEAHGLIAEND